jgi:exodeoxyribonuclease VII small subunit
VATQTFETALKKLEKIVDELESGDLPLEKSLKKFEEGIELSKICSQMLEETEAKISRLVNDASGNLMETPLDDDALTENDI